MARGLVVKVVCPKRADTRICMAFVGSTDVTATDVVALEAKGLKTVGKFAKAASEGDLTDHGFSPEHSIRLIAAFEASEYADLLDYFPELNPPPPASAPVAPIAPSRGDKIKAGLRRFGEGLNPFS